MRAIGLTGFNLTETEASMHADPMRSYNNRSTPLSVAVLFKKLYEENIIGESYAALLKNILLSTSTGPNKIKAALKSGMTLAHKTGTGFALPDGTLTADNDAGVITLPDGRRIYIAVLVKDSKPGLGRQRKAHKGDCGGGDWKPTPDPLPKGREPEMPCKRGKAHHKQVFLQYNNNILKTFQTLSLGEGKCGFSI